ncbi:MAG: alpha/beta hydrolase [Planctomycetota bacterium]|nr:MAG: alpha/beta hydrolase [Planctomycetota bacterium]
MKNTIINQGCTSKAVVLVVALVAISTVVSGCQSSDRQTGEVEPKQEPKKQESDKTLTNLSRTSEFPLRGRLHVPEDVKLERKVVYGSVNGRDLTADILTPTETPLEPRPALVSLHGGSWKGGGPSQFHFHSIYFTSKYGFFCMCVDYRLSGEAKFPAALQDAKCAIRWIRAHALELNIDPERIAIVGGSAGGHLSSMVLTTAGVPEYEGNGGNAGFSSHVNLAILFNGEFDMWDLVKKGSLIKEMKQFMGGTHEEVPERYDELSSVKRIHKDCPPTLLLHGTKDGCVSHKQSIAFYNRLREVGVHSEIEIYEGKPHAWFNREPDRTITLKRMEQFLVSQFKLKAK